MGKRKRILHLGIFMVLSAIVFWELGTLGFGPTNFLRDPLAFPQKCLSQADGYKKWSCFQGYFEKLTRKVSAGAAIAQASKLKEQGVVSDCHLLAHYIGETNLEKHKFNMGTALASCTVGACRYGCVHGVMGRYIGSKGEPRSVAPTIKNVCDGVGLDPKQRGECIHGIGHGLLAHDYLPFQDAVYACQTLGPQREQRICVAGVAMEKVFQDLSLDPSEDRLREIIPEMCTQLESTSPQFMDVCMYLGTLGFLFYTGYDIARTEELCEALPRQEYIDACKNYIPVHIKEKKPSTIDLKEFLLRYKDIQPFQWQR